MAKHHSEMSLDECKAFLEEEKRKFFREGLKGAVVVPVHAIPHFLAERAKASKANKSGVRHGNSNSH